MENKNTFQRILWTIAGAEIPILEKCRTDHKKYGAMGATIAMTSFIAFLSGTSAAWFFTQSGTETSGKIGWAMAFGIVWATLIFCIDRSLVITMKKNPEKTTKTWWVVPFVSRALLALIIAFMVSIPLELVVFEDFISEQEYLWNENKSNMLSKNSRANRESEEAQEVIGEGNNSLIRLDGQKQSLEGEVESLKQNLSAESAKLNNPTTSAYKQANKGLKAANTRITSLRNQLPNADQWQKNNIRYSIGEWQKKRNSYAAIMKSEVMKWNKPIHGKIADLNNQIANKEEQVKQKIKDLNNTQSQVNAAQSRRAVLIQKRDSLVNAHDKTMKQGNHFIQNFEILEYAVGRKNIDCATCHGKGKIKKANSSGYMQDVQCATCNGTGHITTDLPTEWYFLWLIRLLFFIIELLPTVVKIVMPIGAYDRMIYAEEKDMKNYLESSTYLDRIRNMHDMELKNHEEQLRIQKEAEQDIRKKLIAEMKDAQWEIAEAAVKKWKETELQKLENPSEQKIVKSSQPTDARRTEYVV